MKMEKILDVLHYGSYGAYIILKLIFKNRQSFLKVYSYVNECYLFAFALILLSRD